MSTCSHLLRYKESHFGFKMYKYSLFEHLIYFILYTICLDGPFCGQFVVLLACMLKSFESGRLAYMNDYEFHNVSIKLVTSIGTSL